jgi:CRP/FNR family cyclic AMP-dependent transcriptional regulator
MACTAVRYHLREFGRVSMKPKVEIADLYEICGQPKLVSLQAGEFLFREGDPAQALYVVLKGVLRIIRGAVIYETVRSGGIVGEMAIIDTGYPRSAAVIAGTHAELIEIGTEHFLELVRKRPEFSLTVMRVMSRRLRVMNQRYRPNPASGSSFFKRRRPISAPVRSLQSAETSEAEYEER